MKRGRVVRSRIRKYCFNTQLACARRLVSKQRCYSTSRATRNKVRKSGGGLGRGAGKPTFHFPSFSFRAGTITEAQLGGGGGVQLPLIPVNLGSFIPYS